MTGLKDVTSSRLYGSPQYSGKLLPAGRDALSQALIDMFPEWTVATLVALSVQAGAKIPLAYSNPPDQGLPALGTGYVDGIAELNLGVSLYPLPAYLSAGAGYVVRGGPLNDEMIFNVQAGYTLRRLFLKLELQGIKNTVDPPDRAGMPVSQPGDVGQLQFGDQDVLKLIPVVSYSLSKRFQITGEMYHVLGGKNTLAGTTYALGIIFQRKE